MCNQALPNDAITLYGASGPPLLRRMVDDICRKVSGRPTGRENNVIAYVIAYVVAYVIQPEYLLSYLKRIHSGYLSRDWKNYRPVGITTQGVFCREKQQQRHEALIQWKGDGFGDD